MFRRYYEKDQYVRNCPVKQLKTTNRREQEEIDKVQNNIVPILQEYEQKKESIMFVDSKVPGFQEEDQYTSTASDIKPDISDIKDMKRNQDGKTILTGFSEFTDKPKALKSMLTAKLVKSTE